MSEEAILRINPGQLDPKSLSARLGVKPTHIVVKGELAEPGMLDSMATESAWSLSSAGRVHGDATAHLAWLMEQIGDRGDQLSSLQASGVGVTLELTLSRSAREMRLPHSLLQRLVASGLDVQLRFA